MTQQDWCSSSSILDTSNQGTLLKEVGNYGVRIRLRLFGGTQEFKVCITRKMCFLLCLMTFWGMWPFSCGWKTPRGEYNREPISMYRSRSTCPERMRYFSFAMVYLRSNIVRDHQCIKTPGGGKGLIQNVRTLLLTPGGIGRRRVWHVYYMPDGRPQLICPQ